MKIKSNKKKQVKPFISSVKLLLINIFDLMRDIASTPIGILVYVLSISIVSYYALVANNFPFYIGGILFISTVGYHLVKTHSYDFSLMLLQVVMAFAVSFSIMFVEDAFLKSHSEKIVKTTKKEMIVKDLIKNKDGSFHIVEDSNGTKDVIEVSKTLFYQIKSGCTPYHVTEYHENYRKHYKDTNIICEDKD